MPEHVYLIEQLQTLHVVKHDTSRNPPAMTETPVEAWVLVATYIDDVSLWRAIDEWFKTVPDEDKSPGHYRAVEPGKGWSGGQYSEHIIKPSWTVEEIVRPDLAVEVGETADAQAA